MKLNTEHPRGLHIVGGLATEAVRGPDVAPAATPAVSTERKCELLSRVVAVLDEVIEEFGDRDDWKYACANIREQMMDSASFNPDAASVRALAVLAVNGPDDGRCVEPLALRARPAS